MIKKFEAIIFDFDGVVVDSEPLYEKTATELFGSYNVVIPDEDWKLYKGMSQHNFFQTACERYKISVPLDLIKEKDEQILRSHFKDELDYIPGFTDFIQAVPNTIKIGLVTSSSRELINWIFYNTPIENHFSFIITANDITHAKPHPEPFLKMNHTLQLPADRIVVIEDSINGIKSATKAGNITIGLTTSFSSDELKEAQYIAETYNDIKNLLNI